MRMTQAELDSVRTTINDVYKMLRRKKPAAIERADGAELISLWHDSVCIIESVQKFIKKSDKLNNRILNSRRRMT